MNRNGKNYNDMTLEELQQELREAFFESDIIDDSLNDELEKIQAAMNQKRPVEYLYSPEESWEHFLEDKAGELGVLIVPQEEPETRQIRVRATRHRTVPALLRRVLIAAAVVVLLAGAALAADSLGLWAWVPRWNAAAGRYEPAAQEVSGESPIPAALAELGITEPVYPAKLPEGFVITESRISKDPLVLVEQYAREDKHYSITVTPIDGFRISVYQREGNPVREYASGRAVNYVFETERTVTAIRYTKHYATSISGNLTLAEIKEILGSLPEKAG